MFKIAWDNRTNGVILSNSISDEEAIPAPRPVFYEELELLGFNKHWEYDHSVRPFLWCIGRRYYNRGKLVAEVHGGNIHEKPEITILPDGESLKLKPINLKTLIKKNRDNLFSLENEAIDFIEHSYRKNRKKINYTCIAFSGGKDSQVILDLVTRVLPPDQYLVSFTDTDMEIPFTYETVDYSREKYQSQYPDLKFYTAKPHEKSIVMWELFGPPSRVIRWCCSVYKTAPFGRLMNDLFNGDKQPKLLVFEGVRADESPKRSRYERNASKVKHINITNSRPILFWNTTEVLLYLFSRNIEINKGYRYGMTRVGCSICPFASAWSEYIISELFPDLTKGYLAILEKYSKSKGVKGKKKIMNYIKEGHWKTRAGGEGIDTNGTRIDILSKDHNIKAILYNPRESWLSWIKTLGDVVYNQKGRFIIGEIRIKDDIFPFKVEIKKKTSVITIENVLDKPILLSKIKNTLYKSTYCINCGTCEVECPTGALQVIPKVSVNTKKCINCYNCLSFTKRGCLMAKSTLTNIRGVSMGKRSGIDRYSTFGMRKVWLDSYLELLDKWWESEQMSLGVKQVPALSHWLIDAEMIESKGRKPTDFSNIVSTIYYDKPSVFWQLIWVNLTHNSTVAKWYANFVRWDISYTKQELLHMMQDTYPDISEGTMRNAIDALVDTFKSTPLGENAIIVELEKKGRIIKGIKKISSESDIHPIVIAYSLYKYAESKDRRYFTVTEFYDENGESGPYRIFGISRETFEKNLRWLQENKKLLNIELVSGLDNITLKEDITPIEVLSMI